MGDVTGGLTPSGGGEQQLIREISAPLFAAKGWMKFLGVLMIIYGVLIALSIVGIVICWLPIWIGVLLFQTAGTVEAAQASGSKMELYGALSKLKTYFTIYGVLALIGIIVSIIVIFTVGLASLIPFMNNY
ncbi:MAG: DUF5362 domain-containing protein [Candidatus Eisenbacteria bacterium]